MSTFNKVILVGNLVDNPELRFTPNNTAICDIAIAVNEHKTKEVSFFDVTFWDRTAEVVAEYLTKGSSILVEGHLKQERWLSKEGKNHYKVKVVAQTMQMLGKSNRS